MSQPGFDPNQYQPPAGPYAGWQPHPPCPPRYLQGQKYAERSLAFGIVGLFVFGFVFGPLAIINAKKAEELGYPATAGKTLGWIGTALVIGAALFVLGLYLFAAAMTSLGMT